jgi:hypothetical protein
MDIEEHFKDIFDFETFRAEMYFPRARYWTPELKGTSKTNDNLKLLDPLSQKLKLKKDYENLYELNSFEALMTAKPRQFEFDRIKEAVEGGGEFPLTEYGFNVLIKGDPEKQIDEIVDKRRSEGFLIAHFFWFMLRANVHHKGEMIGRSQSPVASALVFEKYVEKFLLPHAFPYFGDRPRTDDEYFLGLKRKLWPSAHIWAALEGPKIKTRKKLKNDDTFFLNLVKRADALYKLGIEHGVYKKITPRGFDEEMILAYDGIIGKPSKIKIPDFTPEEWDFISSYKSDAMQKKRRLKEKKTS